MAVQKLSVVGGTNNALADLHNPHADVVAWDGDFLHIGRLPAHPVNTRDSSSVDQGDSGPPTILEGSSGVKRSRGRCSAPEGEISSCGNISRNRHYLRARGWRLLETKNHC